MSFPVLLFLALACDQCPTPSKTDWELVLGMGIVGALVFGIIAAFIHGSH